MPGQVHCPGILLLIQSPRLTFCKSAVSSKVHSPPSRALIYNLLNINDNYPIVAESGVDFRWVRLFWTVGSRASRQFCVEKFGFLLGKARLGARQGEF
jgi:hypothetical protein